MMHRKNKGEIMPEQAEKYWLSNKQGFEKALEEFNYAAKNFVDASILGKLEAYFKLRNAGRKLDDAARNLAAEINGFRKYGSRDIEKQVKGDPVLQLALRIAEEQNKTLQAVPTKNVGTTSETKKRTGNKESIGHTGKVYGYYIDKETGEVRKK